MQKSAYPLEATAYLRKSLDVLLNKSLICWWARQNSNLQLDRYERACLLEGLE